MPDHNVSIETIHAFLAQKRIAMIGISREPKHFSVYLFEQLCRRGYDVIPVNPNMAEIQGHRCFGRVQDIQPPVTAVLLMTSPAVTDAVAGRVRARVRATTTTASSTARATRTASRAAAPTPRRARTLVVRRLRQAHRARRRP